MYTVVSHGTVSSIKPSMGDWELNLMHGRQIGKNSLQVNTSDGEETLIT
jgi:hypothetical protein